MKRIFSVLLIAPLFIACAHVSKKDCLEKDWQAVGLHDGSSGLVRADMTKIAESCNRFEMANPPADQYLRGYEIGLKQYCTEDRGFSHGERGVLHPGVCGDAEANFPKMIEGWKKGITAYCSYEQGKSSAEAGGRQNQYCDSSLHAAYFKGFETGARAYCSDSRTGFYRGKSGAASFPYCPGSLAGPFERAYAEGARLYAQISAAKDRLANLNGRINALRDKDSSTERRIRSNESRIRDVDVYIERKEDETRRLEAELRKCTRKSELCADSHVDSLERQLKDAAERRSQLRRERSDLSIELPRLASERTRLAVEISTLEGQKRTAERDVAKLEDSESADEGETIHVRPKQNKTK
jgi:hypothetical protein